MIHKNTISVLFSWYNVLTLTFQVVFRIYDTKGDGFLDSEELFEVLKMMVGNNLNEEQLKIIVKKTILESDKDGDKKISRSEFADVSLRVNSAFNIVCRSFNRTI